MTVRTAEPAPMPAARADDAPEIPRLISIAEVCAQLSVSADLVRAARR